MVRGEAGSRVGTAGGHNLPLGLSAKIFRQGEHIARLGERPVNIPVDGSRRYYLFPVLIEGAAVFHIDGSLDCFARLKGGAAHGAYLFT